jgi:hypothetical protein
MAPIVLANDPAGQGVHESALAPENDPAGHGMHMLRPGGP